MAVWASSWACRCAAGFGARRLELGQACGLDGADLLHGIAGSCLGGWAVLLVVVALVRVGMVPGSHGLGRAVSWHVGGFDARGVGPSSGRRFGYWAGIGITGVLTELTKQGHAFGSVRCRCYGSDGPKCARLRASWLPFRSLGAEVTWHFG